MTRTIIITFIIKGNAPIIKSCAGRCVVIKLDHAENMDVFL